ncbi:hypothetical protein D3C87_720000 [compost metagenome]
MTETTITFPVVRAESIDAFYVDGLPFLHFHYFLLSPNGRYTFMWVEEKTDFEWLQLKIEEKAIYIFK